MTEKEIVTYLKQNKTNGVGFSFMPEDVQKWCKSHKDEPIFMHFSIKKWTELGKIACSVDSIYALSEDYEIEPEFEPHWEEFDIDTEGFFCVRKGVDSIYYHWYNWQKVLDDNDKYSNFGGWLYTEGDHPLWYMTPRILVCDSDIAWSEPDLKGENQDWPMTSNSAVDCAEPDIEAKPATPSKIRFWRYAE